MVDSRQKGYTAEIKVRDELRKLTGHQWERTPSSGALNEVHGLKGDLYIPKKNNRYTVEVKSYKDSAINHLLLTGKTPLLITWVEQAERQARQNENEPLLIFKHNRSKLFVCIPKGVKLEKKMVYTNGNKEYTICTLDDFISTKPRFIND